MTRRDWTLGVGQARGGIVLAMVLTVTGSSSLDAIETTTISEMIEWSIEGVSDGSIKFHSRNDQPSGSHVLYFAPVDIGSTVTLRVLTRPNQETNDLREIMISIPEQGKYVQTKLRWSRYAGPSHTWDQPPPPEMELVHQNPYHPFKQVPEVDPRYQADKWLRIQYAEFSVTGGQVLHNIFIIPSSLAQLAEDPTRKGLPEFDRTDDMVQRKKPHGCGGCTPIGLPGFRVNTATLDPVIQDTLYAHGGLGPEVRLVLTYNADPTVFTAFGRSWRLNYDSWVRARNRGAEVLRGDGYRMQFASPPEALVADFTTNGSTVTVVVGDAAGGISGCNEHWDGHYLPSSSGQRLAYAADPETGWHEFRLTSRSGAVHHEYASTQDPYEWLGLTAITDRNGNALQLERGAGGRIEALTDAAGRRIDFLYDANNRCRRIVVPGGATLEFDYDAAGQLIRAVDLIGNTTVYEYDTAGYVTSMNTEGRAWHFTWQDEGGHYLSQVRDPQGGITRYELAVGDWEFRRTRVTDPSGRVFDYQYPKDRYRGSDQPGDSEVTYDAQGRPVVVKAPNGQQRTVNYHPLGLVEQVTDFNGGVNRWTYNENGQPLSYVDGLQGEWRYRYDERGNLIEKTSPEGRVTRYITNDRGQLLSLSVGDRAPSTFTYDHWGHLASVRDPEGHITRYRYDDHGVNLVAVENARGHTHHYQYDANQRLTRIVFPDGSSEEYAYDCCGQSAVRNRNGDWRQLTRTPDLLPLVETDYEGHSITNTYDPAGRLIRRQDSAGNQVAYSYNPYGQPEAVVNALADEAVFLYNQDQELFHLRFSNLKFGPDQTQEPGAWYLSYDAAGNLARVNELSFVRDRNRRWIRTHQQRQVTHGVARDADGWVTARLLNGKTNATFGYRPSGTLARHTHALGTDQFESDQRGYLTNLVFASGHRVARKFNAVGHLEQMVYPDGSVAAYQYDSLDRATNLTWNGASIALRFDPVGNRLAEFRSNGCDSDYAYDRNGLITNLTHRGPSTVWLGLACTRDTRGLTVSRWKTEGAVPWNPSFQQANIAAEYRVDSALIRWQGTDCAADADANQTSLGDARGFSASYTAHNLLQDWTIAGIEHHAVYDGLDRLIHWQRGNQVRRFFYDELDRLLFECDGQGRITASYLYLGRQPVALRDHQGIHFFHLDLTGNVAMLTDETGRPSALYRYLPYGSSAGAYSRVANPFTFVGGYGVIDLGEGLYWMRYRVYDAVTRAFLSRDPLGYQFDFNPRRYVLNSPVDMIDPSGLSGGIAGGTPLLEYHTTSRGDNCVVVATDKTLGLSKWGPLASLGKIGYALWEKDWDTAASETGMAMLGLWSATGGLAIDFILTPSNANAYAQGETEEDRIRQCLEYQQKTGISYNLLDKPQVPDYSTDQHLQTVTENYGNADE